MSPARTQALHSKDTSSALLTCTARTSAVGASQQTFEQLFSIGDHLGKGRFGHVFACRSRSSATLGSGGSGGQAICVKVEQIGSRPTTRPTEMVTKEKFKLFRELQAIHHPNVVACYELMLSSEAFYTVMQRCMGPSLVDYVGKVHENQLLADDVRRLASQILAALGAVHRLGVMHRDVKPDNFRFLDMDAETLQLLDFGFAKQAPKTATQHSVTGTLLYVAPEVFDGLYSHKCDLWSAGVLLFELLVGRTPFNTCNVSILRCLHRDPVLMGSDGELFRGDCWEEVPVVATDLVRGLLMVDTAKRLSADEAMSHAWFGSETNWITYARRPSSRTLSSNCTVNFELKRSCYAWNNLAEASLSESNFESESEFLD